MTLLTLDPGIGQNLAIGIIAAGVVGVVVLILLDVKRAKAEAAAQQTDLTPTEDTVDETVIDVEPDSDEDATEVAVEVSENTVSLDDTQELEPVVADEPATDDESLEEPETTESASDVEVIDEDVEEVASEADDSTGDAQADVVAVDATDTEPEITEADDPVAVIEEVAAVESDDLTPTDEPVSEAVVEEVDAPVEVVADEEYDLYAPVEGTEEAEFEPSAFGAVEDEFSVSEAVNEEDETATLTLTPLEDQDDMGAAAVIAAAEAVTAVAVLETEEEDDEPSQFALEDDLVELHSPEIVVDTAEVLPGWGWLLPAGVSRTVSNVTVSEENGVVLAAFQPGHMPGAWVHAAYVGGVTPPMIVFKRKDAPADAEGFDAVFGVKASAEFAGAFLVSDVREVVWQERSACDGFVLDGGWLFTVGGPSETAGPAVAAIARSIPESVQERFGFTPTGNDLLDASGTLLQLPDES